jgi:hydroxymethylbilane synthase
MKTLTIASRESRLALWQAEHIQTRLQELYPDLTVNILPMTTQGDQILDKTLSKIGGKGLFVKELETALLDGRADIAVHSAKDVPMVLPEGFTLAAICEREDARDAFVSNRYGALADLPEGAVVGTASLRREAQIRARFPHLQIQPLRGNVQTRLRKLDEGEFDAIILASAGLIRLELAHRITGFIDVAESLPAPGQGALAIEISAARPDLLAVLAPLNHASTVACVLAERTLSRFLGGSCQIPLGAYATETDGLVTLKGLVASVDGLTVLKTEATAPLKEAEALGALLAEQLRVQGAQTIIDDILKAI